MKNYWRVLQNHSRPLRFLTARVLTLTGLCRFLTVPQRGFCLRFHPANLAENLWINPALREEGLAFFRAYLKEGDIVVDVGANIGDTVLASAVQVGHTGHVTGIEAHPRTFRFLEENIRLNKAANVTVIHSAVGDESGTVRFSDSRYDDMNQVNHGSLEVPINRLDDLVPTSAPVALLKVDVEGYERHVFRGAPRLLAQAECVYFEVGEKMCTEFGYTSKEIIADIQAQGFHLFIHSSNGTLLPLAEEQTYTPYQNVVAARDVADLLRRTRWVLLT